MAQSPFTMYLSNDVVFLHISGTCQYAVIRLVVNYQSPQIHYFVLL